MHANLLAKKHGLDKHSGPGLLFSVSHACHFVIEKLSSMISLVERSAACSFRVLGERIKGRKQGCPSTRTRSDVLTRGTDADDEDGGKRKIAYLGERFHEWLGAINTFKQATGIICKV